MAIEAIIIQLLLKMQKAYILQKPFQTELKQKSIKTEMLSKKEDSYVRNL